MGHRSVSSLSSNNRNQISGRDMMPRHTHRPPYNHLVRCLSVLLVGLSAFGCGDDIIPPPVQYGPEWRVYTTGDSPLVSDTIWSITTDESGVWIGTSYGVNFIDGDRWRRIIDDVNDEPILPLQRISSIALDSKGAVWFGLATRGILYFNTNSAREHWVYINDPLITHNFVYSIAADSRGDVWIGTDYGVTRFRYGETNEIADGRWQSFNERNSVIPNEPIRRISFDGYNNLVWFGTSSLGAISYNSDQDWNISTPSNAPLPIISMAFTPDRVLWVGTFSDWAYRYVIASEEWFHIGTVESEHPLPSHIVNDVAVKDGTIWFATENGLAESRNGKWTVFNSGNSPLPSNVVRCLDIDRKGNLWIGTTGGIVKYRFGGTIP